jgi:transposase
LPLAVLLSSGAAYDGAYFHPLLAEVSIAQKTGRPRTKPAEIVADKAYGATALRSKLRKRGIRAMIPEKRLPEGRRRRKKGPHYRFNKDTYKKRAVIEQRIGWLKEGRRIATRYEKLAVNFLAMIKLAFVKVYLKMDSSDTA